MISVEIKINGQIREVISALNKEPDALHPKYDYWARQDATTGEQMYIVNGVHEVWHKRSDGHRELARKMLDAIRRLKP